MKTSDAIQPRNRLLWIGKTSSELSWLANQLENHCDVTHTDSYHPEQFENTHFQRVIIGCDCRVDFPSSEIACIRRKSPEIPIAIALGAWWEGGRRTSQVSVEVPLFNWHRVWENWIPWVTNQRPELLQFSPSLHPKPDTGPKPGTGFSTTKLSGGQLTVVANQRANAIAIQLMADTLNVECNVLRYDVAGLELAESGNTGWFIWDDSCWNDGCLQDNAHNNPLHPNTASQFELFLTVLGNVRHHLPKANHLLCWNCPQWSLIEKCQNVIPAVQFLTKPFAVQTVERIIRRH